jgi:hypothetical protein
LLLKGYVNLKPYTSESAKDFSIKFNIDVSHTWIKEDLDHMVIHDLNIKPVASNLQFKTKKFTAKCDRKILRCGPVFFYYNPSIKALGSSKIDLKNVKSLEDNLPIEKISFEYITGDPKFISFLSGLKIGCFFISVLFLSFYYIKYKKVPVETRVIE